MLDRAPPPDHLHHAKRVHWLWTPILALPFWLPWSVVLLIEKIPLGVGLAVLLVMYCSIAGIVEQLLRSALNANFRRLANFYRVHDEAKSSSQPIALLLRSFSQVHGHLDWQTGFSIFWLLDDTLREAGLQPVLLGSDVSLPDEHGTLLIPTENNQWKGVFETFAEAAAVIIVVPELTGSLQTEMHLLKERGWLAKTVAVMTPKSVRMLNVEMTPGQTLGGDDDARRERWEEAREHLSLQGLKLPPYNADGALIEWSDGGDVRARTPLGSEASYSSQHDDFPYSSERRQSFCRCWRSVQTRRRFHGRSTSKAYLLAAPALTGARLGDVLNPPGSDGALRRAIDYLLYIGWVWPLALFLVGLMV